MFGPATFHVVVAVRSSEVEIQRVLIGGGGVEGLHQGSGGEHRHSNNESKSEDQQPAGATFDHSFSLFELQEFDSRVIWMPERVAKRNRIVALYLMRAVRVAL